MVVYIVPEGRNSTERVQAEAARLEREARYRMVFEALDEGFCVIELHFDERDNPVDDTFVEANPAFVNQTGLVHANGRRAKEMVPTLEDHWIEIYGKVALPGEATRFQDSSVPMGRWFGVSAFRIGQPDERLVALLCTDVTPRGRTRDQSRPGARHGWRPDRGERSREGKHLPPDTTAGLTSSARAVPAARERGRTSASPARGGRAAARARGGRWRPVIVLAASIAVRMASSSGRAGRSSSHSARIRLRYFAIDHSGEVQRVEGV